MNTDSFSISRALAGVAVGPALEAQLYPLSNVGALRVTYNWLYSALNCDPSDSSSFTWVISRLAGNTVCLSPKGGYGGMTLFASVRPEWSYYVQVQAPGSADWIQAAGGDEWMQLGELGFMTISLQGVNNLYLAVDPSATEHDDHAGYKLQSNASAPGDTGSFFLAVTQSLQTGLDVPLISDVSTADIIETCAASGASDPEGLARRIAGVR